jgi:hypothetical protein
VYGECGLSEDGEPLERFLIDPPLPVSPAELGISPIGVKLIEREGVWHVLDWIGEDSYPNVADFLEEARRYGVSRRLAKTIDFAKLGADSRMILIHRRAWIEQREPYVLRKPDGKCPCGVAMHLPRSLDQMCAALWWEDIDPHEPVVSFEIVDGGCRRTMPAGFDYAGLLRPDAAVPEYAPAIFASFPLANIAVVRDPIGGTHNDAADAASKAGVPLDIVDE